MRTRATEDEVRGAVHVACVRLEAWLEGHPEDAPAHRALARAAQRLGEWHGAFELGTTGARVVWRPVASLTEERPDVSSLAEPLAGARQAIERAVALDPDRLAWWAPLAELREATGDLAAAVEAYDHLLAGAERSDSPWVNRVRHLWQFRAERAHHRAGAARVEDPLFAAEVVPGPLSEPPSEMGGVARARFTHQGLNLGGVVPAGGPDTVEVRLDGEVVRTVNLGAGEVLRAFDLVLRRETLSHLPERTRIELLVDGGPLWIGGRTTQVEVRLPGAQGTLRQLRAEGVGIDKKGMIGRRADELDELQTTYLRLYDRARATFERQGHPLLVLYGTLLGLHRDGDLIPGDDDFDVGYVSRAHDPEQVKQEAIGLIRALVKDGFTVSVNRRGRLFRVHRAGYGAASLHLDAHPIWFQDGRLFVPNHVSFPASVDDFLPPRQVTLRGATVLTPRDPEVFLSNHYGPSWRVPDPGYVDDASQAPGDVVATLDRALLTPKQQQELADEIVVERAADPTYGRFVPIGSQSLYPLSDLIE